MGEHQRRHVLIIGAGSMGLIVGYILSLSGVKVTFLVRPHHAETLSRPQLLYCYNDNQLKTFSGYKYITDPSNMIGADYDYIVITLDGKALRDQVGQSLVKKIGEAVHGTEMQVVIGTVFVDVKTWFLQLSGLSSEQVGGGQLLIHAYSPKAVTLPLHAPTDQKLVAQADLAYTDVLGPGFIIENGSPDVANGFAEIYNASGVSHCAVVSPSEYTIGSASLFPILAVSELLGWPKYQDIDSNGELWSLAVAAVKEIQRLSICGEAGSKAAETTTEAGIAAMFSDFEKRMLPLDFKEFNRYHHGAKVNAQDRELLRTCLSYGEPEGKPMSALRELLQLLD